MAQESGDRPPQLDGNLSSRSLAHLQRREGLPGHPHVPESQHLLRASVQDTRHTHCPTLPIRMGMPAQGQVRTELRPGPTKTSP